jgi:hypothetical protein
MLGFADLKPDCWLEVSLHLEGPATGQLDQGFPWSQSKCWVGTQIPRCTACFPCSNMVTLRISPCTNMTLTFDFGLDHPVQGGYGWGSSTQRRLSDCQTKKLKSGYVSHWRPGTKTNWPTDRRSQCNLKLNLRHCTANYRPVLSSGRAPYMKNKERHCHSDKCTIWSPAPSEARYQDELADWPSVVMWLLLR